MDRRDVEHGQLSKAFSHIGTALALAGLDLGVKAWAEQPTAGRLTSGCCSYGCCSTPASHSGSATPLPAGVVLAVTGLMVAVILGGAISNLADRAADGLV